MADEKPRGKLDALIQRVEVSEEGIYRISGLRQIVLPAQLFPELQAVGDRFLGRGWDGVMYYVGEAFGRQVAGTMRASMGNFRDPAVARAYMVEILDMRGFGRTEVTELDFETGRGVARLYDCPFDDPRAERPSPSCPFPAGVSSGIISVLSGKDLLAEETHCRSRGEEWCEFVTAAIPLHHRRTQDAALRGRR